MISEKPASACTRTHENPRTAHWPCVTLYRRAEAGMQNRPQRPQVLILGAGFGGLEATKALARADVDVTLVDAYNHHCFQPLLYQVATAALSPADVAWPIRAIMRRQKN